MRYDTENDMAVVAFFNFIDDDIYGLSKILNDVAYKSKSILGYTVEN